MDSRSVADRSRNMSRVRGKDTKPELRVRSIAHRLGLRFRLHHRDLPGRPDMVLARHKLVVFVHGCFWHRHEGCRKATMPATRADFWQIKFEATIARDQRQQAALKTLGWRVLVIWECELKDELAVIERLKEVVDSQPIDATAPRAHPQEPQRCANIAVPTTTCDQAQLGSIRSRGAGIKVRPGSGGISCAGSSNLTSRTSAMGVEAGATVRADGDLEREAECADAQERLACADLFAGAGGFSLAATRAGLAVRLAVEHDRNACRTYRRNFCVSEPAPTLVEKDIRALDPLALAVANFPAGAPCSLLLGGPPCQGFSTHRINDAGVGDKRNDLIHVYFDFVRAFAPRAFLMENVPGMLWPRHKEALERFYREGAEAGYSVLSPAVLDARDYGIGQRRKRVFVLGLAEGVTLGDLVWPPPPTHGSPAARKANPALKSWQDCSAVFVDAPPDDPNDVHMNHGRTLIEAFEKTPPNGGSRHDSGRLLACHDGHDGHNDVYGRIDPAEPAPTMTTACINPSKGRFVHPTLNHGITVRQAARIQTFPDDFVFEGGLMAAGEQVGNAVPVSLGQRLIEHLKPVLQQMPLEDGRKATRPRETLGAAA